MSATTHVRKALLRPVPALVALGIVAALLVWLFAYFLPESRKLSSLHTEQTQLTAVIAKDNARVAKLKKESKHIGQIKSIDSSLKGYVPKQQDLYGYIRTLNHAAKGAGVTISSLAPQTLAPVTGTSYSAIPIAATVKGSYAQLVAFLHGVYGLPRLTDVNGFTLSGGGPGSSSKTTITAQFQLAIFTSYQLPTASTTTTTTSGGGL